MIAYLDTSALVKLFLPEEGTDVVRAVWDAVEAKVTSAAAYPEARAALESAARQRRITRRSHGAAVSELDRRIGSMDVVELRRDLSLVAGAVASRFGLRGSDAIHLTSALAVDAGSTTFVSWDRALAAAAGSAGLAVIPAIEA